MPRQYALDFTKPFKTMCFKIPRAQTLEERPFGCCSWNRCKTRNDNKDKALRLALRVKDIELIIDQLKFFSSFQPYKYVTIVF